MQVICYNFSSSVLVYILYFHELTSAHTQPLLFSCILVSLLSATPSPSAVTASLTHNSNGRQADPKPNADITLLSHRDQR